MTFATLLLVALAGQAEESKPVPTGKELPTVKELRAVAEEVTIDDQKLKLESYLWRDAMPGVGIGIGGGAGGKGLLAAVTLRTADGKSPLPKGITVERLWLINGDQVWQSPPITEIQREKPDSPSLVVSARNGPNWQPGGKVEVIALLKDSKGQPQRLRISGQSIETVH